MLTPQQTWWVHTVILKDHTTDLQRLKTALTDLGLATEVNVGYGNRPAGSLIEYRFLIDGNFSRVLKAKGFNVRAHELVKRQYL